MLHRDDDDDDDDILPDPRAVSGADEDSAKPLRKVRSWRGLPHRETAISTGKSLLHQRLHHLQLREVPMASDGNCQFRSLSHQLFGSHVYHEVLRHRIVQFLRENADLYQWFIDEDFGAYCNRMDRPSEWGDETTLAACAALFRVRVHLLSNREGRFYDEYAPDGPEPPIKHCFIMYDATDDCQHYDAFCAARLYC